jgi:ADP-heptose:LPS heptosyltransferase
VRYELEDNLELLRALDVPPQGREMELHVPAAAFTRAEALVAAGRRFVVLAPGGGENAGWSMPQKRWPVERFAALARALHERPGLATVVVGGPQDDGLAAEIARRAAPGTVTDATGNSLAVSAAIIGRGSLLVTNDSVAMHLGLVLHTPFVALFGPTNPRAVLPPDGPFRVLLPDVPCSPCFWQEKPGLRSSAGRGSFEPCPRFERSCLESITVDSVAKVAMEML